MTDPTPRPPAPRRRSPDQASGMASALFQSFTAPPPAPAVAEEPPSASPASAAPGRAAPPVAPTAEPTAIPVPDVDGGAPAPTAMRDASPARESTAAAPVRPRTTRSGAGERSGRPSAAPQAPSGGREDAARPARPSRPRLVDPTPYATKHRDVRSARIQALLRETDLDVLDEVSRLTQDHTGEETNRSELLRALVEALAVAGVTGELAECGTHRGRVTFLANRLRG